MNNSRTFIAVSGIVISLGVVSCAEGVGNSGKKNGREASATNQGPQVAAGPPGAPAGAGPGGPGGAGARTAVVGDVYVQIEESKSWRNAQAEPVDWSSRTKNSYEVIKLYDSAQDCKARLKIANQNIKITTNLISYSESDLDCKSSGFQCGGAPTCVTSELPTKTVGPFADAVGVQRVCTIVSCSGTNSSRLLKLRPECGNIHPQ